MAPIQLSPEAEAALRAVCYLIIALVLLLTISTLSSVFIVIYLALRAGGFLKKQGQPSRVLRTLGSISLFGSGAFLALILFVLVSTSASGGFGDFLENIGEALPYLLLATANVLIGWFARKNA